MRAPALAELHEIFLGQVGGALELVAGKHYRCDTANAELRKDGSLAVKFQQRYQNSHRGFRNLLCSRIFGILYGSQN